MDMKYTVIADSCCSLYNKDLTNDKIDFHVVPLTLIIGDQEFVDDEKLDTVEFVKVMNESKACPKSACPSPEAFYEIMKKGDNIIVVTLSSKLSATHSSAMTAAENLKKSHPNKKLFVCDTLSAATGLDFILYKLRDLIMEGKLSFDEITVKLSEICRNTRVRFLLQDLGNLVKNGRMSKMAGRILTTAKIKLICGEDGHGEIKKCGMALGTRRGLCFLAEYSVKEMKAQTGSETKRPIFINHVHNQADVDFLQDLFKTKYGYKNISVRLFRGLSSLYSADKGIVVAY